jgi:GAF domain-containing protein
MRESGPAPSRSWFLTGQKLEADMCRRMAVSRERTGDNRPADEQAALRRVATLVARGTAPEEVFAAVTEEAGRLLGTELAFLSRYNPDGTRTVVASRSTAGAAFAVGTRVMLGGRNVPTVVVQTGRAARIDDYAGASGPVAEASLEFGVRAAVGVPVNVEGRLWGVMTAASPAGR